MQKKLSMLFFVLCLLVAAAHGATCTTDSDCYGNALTTNPAWVRCNTASSTCACVSDRGYVSGNATTDNKCRCDAPNQLTADQGQVYCFSVQAAVQAKTRCDRNKAVVEKLYSMTVLGPNRLIVAGIVDVSDIFAPDIKGRVNPLGQWNGFQKMLEYYFGPALSEYGYVGTVMMRDLICEGDVTRGRADVYMNFTLSPIARFAFNNLTQNFRFKHDPSSGAITFADVGFENMGAAADIGPDDTIEPFPGFFLNKRDIVKGAICDQIQATCTGEHEEYANVTECVVAQNAIPWGTWNRANDQSFVCHQVHTTLTGVDPAIHCPHVSPSGGDACHVFSQQSYYTDLVEEAYTYNKIVGVSEFGAGDPTYLAGSAKKRSTSVSRSAGDAGDSQYLGYYVDAYIAREVAKHQQQQQKRSLLSEKKNDNKA